MHKALTLKNNGWIDFHPHRGPRTCPREFEELKLFLVNALGFIIENDDAKVEKFKECGPFRRRSTLFEHTTYQASLTLVRKNGVKYTVVMTTTVGVDFYAVENYGSTTYIAKPLKLQVSRSDLPKGRHVWKGLQWEGGFHTICASTRGWKRKWASESPLLQTLRILPLREEDLAPELGFKKGVGLIVTRGVLDSEWTKTLIRHYLEDGSTLFEQVMARNLGHNIQIKRLFDLM